MTSKTTRLAAAGLLALMLPLAQGSIAHADIRTTLVPVRSQADVVTRDITRASTRTSTLPQSLRTQVANAITSAHCATCNAQDALRAISNAEPYMLAGAQESLQDACTALDAASAELRFVTDQVRGVDPQVTQALEALQRDIDLLRS